MTVSWPGRRAPLGAHPDSDGTNFAIWAPTADAVDLCLFGADGTERRVALADRSGDIWHAYLPGVAAGQHYGYRVHGRYDPAAGHRCNPAKLLVDPYARAITGGLANSDVAGGSTRDGGADPRDSAAFVPRGVVVTPGRGRSAPLRIPWEETILYELHVRGFTMRHPALPAELRGTYAGLAHPAVLAHLTDLGVTSVELLPVHHFVTEPALAARGLSNYWGYNTLGFFAPHAGYSATGSTGGQVREFRDMVDALHGAGLEVILDVVYNHSAEGDATGPTLSFRGIDNAAYYRLDRHDRGRYADTTGCGSTLDTARPQVLTLVMDSLRYWAGDMGVDGFRFDLATTLARTDHGVDMQSNLLAAIAQDPLLGDRKLIAEPWDLGPDGYQVGRFPPQWTEWNDQYRDTIRTVWSGARAGVRELGYRLTGSSDLYRDHGRRSFASVNFVTAHDGFTLRDLVSYEHKHNEANGEGNRDGECSNLSWNCGVEGPASGDDAVAVEALRSRQTRNLLATLLLSTGVPMLVAGDELGRTQRGNNNAYCQDNDVSYVDWATTPATRDLLAWTTELIDLRRRSPVLRQPSFVDGRPLPGGVRDLAWFTAGGTEMTESDWLSTDTRTVSMYLDGRGITHRDPRGRAIGDESYLVVVHADGEAAEIALPGLPWASDYVPVLDTAGPAGTAAVAGVCRRPGRSVWLLRVRRGLESPADAGQG